MKNGKVFIKNSQAFTTPVTLVDGVWVGYVDGNTITTTTTAAPTIFAPGANSANFNSCADWDGQDGNVTTVGSNGGPSAYGTYDQSGNVDEWHDLDGLSGSSRGLRGGNWLNAAFFLSRPSQAVGGLPSYELNYVGFRLASSFSSLNPLALSNFVTVGDVNNASDTNGKGGVDYSYAIGKYLVTNSEYVEFLNAVAATDTSLYNGNMSIARGGITRSGTSGSYVYTIKTNYGNKPVSNVSWFDCARYCNWLHNGKPTGVQDSSTTESGAYTLNGVVSGNSVAKNAGAKYHIPTENEWCKAAYYKGGGTNAGYWVYATQSDTAPTCVSADASGNGPVATTTTTAAPTTTTTTTAAPTTTTTTTTTTTAAPTTTTTTTTTAAPISSLAVVSGSTQGDGTSASPYLVAADTSPSPIYQANTPGLLTVSFTNMRTASYNCGKSGCDTGRFNESVYFDRNDGNFYEQIRTNIDNTTSSTSFGGAALLTNASRNTLTTISYPMHKGQKLRMSQHSVIPDGYPPADARSAADNNRQLTNARISFTPMNNPSFSVSYVGTRGVIGNGTPSNPYVSTTNFSSNPNERTHSFMANGDGIIALFGWYFSSLLDSAVPLNNNSGPHIYVGGSANSFSGSRALNKLDMFNFTESPYNTITRPRSRFNLLKVTDGQIFSFAAPASDKGGSWIQERQVSNSYRPMFCCVPNSASDLGIWLMNTRVSMSSTRWQPSNTWSGQGTQASPANMNSFTSSVNGGGGADNMSNIYLTMDGALSFNYEITNSIPVTIIKTLAPGVNDSNAGDVTLSTLSNSSGSLTLNVKAFNAINFLAGQTYSKSGTFMSTFKITNLIFTPS